MTMTKSLMLGTAAAVVALGSAQAADLPVKARAVEYVKVCSLYGAGFYYIPGSDTCIRIGGAIRVDTAFNGTNYDKPLWQGGAAGANAYGRDYFSTRARLNLFIDTRTATEFGVLRTYANNQFDWTQGSSGIGGGSPVEVDYAFIQFAGFTFGKAVSQFDPQWTLGRPSISSGMNAGSYNATGIPQLAFTAQFGNGLSGTISLEDAVPYRSAGVINTSRPFIGPFGATTLPTGAYGFNNFLGNAQGGDHVPDIVANVRLDQAWGSLHLGAAAHEVHGSYYGANGASSSGHPDAKWGYALTGAFELKNLPTGVGDSFKAEASFGHGAAKYVWGGTPDLAGAGRFARLGGSSVAGADGSMAFGYVFDGVYSGLGTAASPGTALSLSDAWEVSAYFEHYWTPAWRTSLFGNYSYVSYGSASDALLLAAANGGLLSTGTTAAAGSFAFSTAQIGTRTAWTPVKDLTLSAEVMYSRMSQRLTGTFTSAAAGLVPGYGAGATFELKNQNAFNGSVQILRSF